MRREDTVVGPLPGFGSAASSSFDTMETRIDAGQRRLAQVYMPQPSAPPPAPRVAPRTAPPPPPALTQTLAALEKEAPAAPAAATRAPGTVIVVFGCRGGCGATTLAVNTGAALARAGRSVCLVDLDLQLGDVFVALDLEPSTSLAALAREAGTIDGPALRRRLVRHDSGLYALGQTGRIDDVDPQLAERMPALVATLVDHFDVVIVDGVRDFGDHALAALDMADRVALVVTQDVAAVRRAARAMALFRKLGYSERKLELVVNRHAAKAAIADEEIERALGLRVGARVKNDYARASRAMNDGALLHDVARGAPVVHDLDALAVRLAGAVATTPTATTAPRAGLLARLFRRSK
jgi:pilus assembly protein CpaE